MIKQDYHTNGDGAVCNIKCRPVVISDVKIKKIHYFSIYETVNQVSDGTAEYQGQPKGEKNKLLGSFVIKPHDHQRHYGRDKEKDKFSDLWAAGGKKTKRTAWIQNVGDIKKVPNDYNTLIKSDINFNQILGDLVQQHNNPADEKKSDPRIFNQYIQITAP